jgi:Ca2+-binding EF-hand superfamily protein
MALCCLLTLAIGGCHGTGGRPTFPSVQFSPNAEPLSGGPLGHPTCADALSTWFDRVDVNHDGNIDREEFLADARAQFERMDRHHAGYVTAADLSEFRAPYEVEGIRKDSEQSDFSEDSPERRPIPGGIPGSEIGTDQRNNRRGASSHGPNVDIRADPVMSADKTLSFKVTLNDFITQANDIFNGLDHNRDGRLSRDSVIGTCKDKIK